MSGTERQYPLRRIAVKGTALTCVRLPVGIRSRSSPQCAIAAARERSTREGESSLRGTAMRLGQAQLSHPGLHQPAHQDFWQGLVDGKVQGALRAPVAGDVVT
jgi:hypothetical protein